MSIRTLDNRQECERKLSEATGEFLAGHIDAEMFVEAHRTYGPNWEVMISGHVAHMRRLRERRQSDESLLHYSIRRLRMFL